MNFPDLSSNLKYIMELSLLDCDNYLTYKPSMIAASSLFLAAHIVPYNDVKLTDIEKVCDSKTVKK